MTDLSHTQEIELPCPGCGVEAVRVVWFIVDVSAREDLIFEARDGRLNAYTCPACGAPSTPNLPLLSYWPDEAPSLLFCPPVGVPPENAQVLMYNLVDRIIDTLEGRFDGRIAVTTPQGHRDAIDARRVPAPPPALERQLQAVHALEQQYTDHGDLAALQRAPDLWEAILAEPAFATASPRFRASTLNDASMARLDRFKVGGAPEDPARAVELMRQVQAVGLVDQPEWPMHLNNLGLALHNLQTTTGDLAALDEAIEIYRQSCAHTWEGSPDLGRHLNNFGTGLTDRYRVSGLMTDLDNARVVFEAAAKFAPSRQMARTNLANVLEMDFRARGGLVDLRRAIELRRALVRSTGRADAHAGRVNALAKALLNQHYAMRDPAALEEAIALAHTASAESETDLEVTLALGLLARFRQAGARADLDEALAAADRALARGRTAEALNTASITRSALHDQGADAARLDEAIALLREAVGVAQDGSEIAFDVRQHLASNLSTRFELNDALADLDEAIRLGREATESVHASGSYRAVLFNNLVSSVRRRFTATGDRADLDALVARFDAALCDVPADHVLHAELTSSLATSYWDRFESTGEPDDLERSLSLGRQALDEMGGAAPEYGALECKQAIGLRSRYHLLGELADLEASIAAARSARGRLKPGAITHVRASSVLANGLRDRYTALGESADLDTSIALFELVLSAGASVDRAQDLANQCLALLNRFEREGSTKDLDRAREAAAEAVELTSPDSTELPHRLTSYANMLLLCYRRSGALAQLEEVIATYRRAVDATPSASPRLNGRLINLGNVLLEHHRRTADRSYVNEAITTYERALSTLHDNAPARSMALSNLVSPLLLRRQGGDLDRAIELADTAVELLHEGSIERVGRLTNLGLALRVRYSERRQPEDARRARDMLSRAARRAPPRSADQLTARLGLAQLHRAVHDADGDPAEADAAHAEYRAVCEAAAEASPYPAARISAAADWARWAFRRREWALVIEATEHALDAIDALYKTSLLRRGKESWLKEIRELPAIAAQALARSGRLDNAVVALERFRARILSDAVDRDRADLDRLRARAPELHDRYVAAAQALTMLERDELHRPAGASTRTDAEIRSLVARHRTALDEVVTRVRLHSGLESFQATPDAQAIRALSSAARPIVYLAVTVSGSLACCVTPSSVAAVWIDAFAADDVVALLVGDGEAAPGVLSIDHASLRVALDRCQRRLGALMEPVVTQLAAHRATGAVLIPTGLLGLLPLQAALIDERTTALDRLALSFAPSARVLGSARTQLVRANAPRRLVGVADPQPETDPLPAAREELAGISALFAPEATALYGADATADALRALDGAATHWHLACHGVFDARDPLRSALALADGSRLTLRDVRYDPGLAALRRVRLVVLSACESAISEVRRLPDEAIGLPAAFLRIGAPSVIGSLWRIADVPTALMMLRFYEVHCGDLAGGGPGDVATALRSAQLWLRDLRAADLARLASGERRSGVPERLADAYANLAAAILLDGVEGDRPFAAAVDWAGLIHLGA